MQTHSKSRSTHPLTHRSRRTYTDGVVFLRAGLFLQGYRLVSEQEVGMSSQRFHCSPLLPNQRIQWSVWTCSRPAHCPSSSNRSTPTLCYGFHGADRQQPARRVLNSVVRVNTYVINAVYCVGSKTLPKAGYMSCLLLVAFRLRLRRQCTLNERKTQTKTKLQIRVIRTTLCLFLKQAFIKTES